jgi:hypothetical protein
MIRAFQENFLGLDADHIAAQKAHEKEKQEKAEREVREKQEERARQMEATKRKREEEEHRREIRRLTEEQTRLQTQLKYNIETQRKAYSNRRAEAIPKAQQRLAEIKSKLNMIVSTTNPEGNMRDPMNVNEEGQPPKSKRPRRVGGGDGSRYADIQSNPEIEMQFILMLAYYPIYLQKYNVEHVDASDYMTHGVWNNEVSHYFQVNSGVMNTTSKSNSVATMTTNTFDPTTYHPLYDSNNIVIKKMASNRKTHKKRKVYTNWVSSNSNMNNPEVPSTPTRPKKSMKHNIIKGRQLSFASKAYPYHVLYPLNTIYEGGHKRSTRKRSTRKRSTKKQRARQ